MKLIIEGYNKSIHKKDNQIQIKEKRTEIYKIPVKKIESITIVGKGYITFDALSLLSKNNIQIISISYYGQIEYILHSPNQTNPILRKQQYNVSENQKGIEIARNIIIAKLKNQKSTLRTLNKNKKDPIIKINEKFIKENISKLTDMKIDNRNEIMGIEGISSVQYWQAIKETLPESVNFQKRDQKPKNDIVNAMLNYGYAILASEITKNIVLHGLDPYCGFLHADNNKRTSLTYDLIEEFRQQIVDKTVLKLINTKQITEEDLDKRTNSLKLEIRKILAAKIMDKLNRKIKYQDRTLKYKDIIENQTKEMTNAIMNDKKYEGFYLNW